MHERASMVLLLTVLGALYWGLQTLLLARAIRGVPRVASLHAPPPPRWPRVSVVMPARNEEAELEDALRSRLVEGYPELELVLVNDRSTDGTGARAEALARREPRLRVVHLGELPEGWLGKVHAMQRGLEQSSGEWVLFSDADIHLAPGTLARLVAHAEATGLGHLCVLPRITARGPLLLPALTTTFRLVCAGARPWAVADPESSASMGVGAFNLVRRGALERTPGLEWLRMETADDAALGAMLKRCGARQAVFNGRDEVSLRFYPSLRALVRALEKNGAAAPLPMALAGCALLVLLEWAPLAGLLSGRPALVLTGALSWAVAAGGSAAAARWLGFPLWSALVPALGVLPLTWAMARSSVLAWVRGGVRWRDTFYPLHALREGLRMRPGGFVLPAPAKAPEGTDG